MRNPNGYGTTFKLSGKRRNPWVAKITIGWNEKGQPIQKPLGYFPDRITAMLALAEYNKNPYDIKASEVTVSELFVVFKERRFAKISESGRYVYSAAFKHLKPLHNTKMKELKTYQMQKLVDSIDRKRQTKDHVLTLLHQMFEIAIELDICDKNYSTYVKLEEKEKSTIHKPFTADQIALLTENIFAQEYADTALIMIYTGLRPSELLSIEIKNIDIDHRTMIGGSKTKAGKNRIIPIHNKILPLIKKRYHANHAFLVEYNGKKLSYSKYKNKWDLLMTSVSMNHLPHDCRHTFASLMDTSGANKLATKMIMGHASQDITDDIYTHKNVFELLKNVDLI